MTKSVVRWKKLVISLNWQKYLPYGKLKPNGKNLKKVYFSVAKILCQGVKNINKL